MPKFKKGNIINDRFLLIECLGTGIFSEVWRAIDETLDTEVALKVYSPLTPDGMKELKREYGNTIGVTHQNLLTPQGMDVFSEGAYLVMKCCSKGSASSLAGLVDEETVWHFVHDVAAGLAYLHGLDEPIIHQDMKLANIMIDDDERFLISDFGICYKVTQIMVRQTGRGRSAAMAYMSPERFSADYDQPLTSSDIWTLGALIYELCTGATPFGDFGGAAQRNGQLPPRLTGRWSKELQMLYNACMQLNTWDRPKATRIREFATLMLRKQHPGPGVLGIPEKPAEPVSDYHLNTPESLFGAQEAAQQPAGDIPAAADTPADGMVPEYLKMGDTPADPLTADIPAQVPDGYERVEHKEEEAHFTSGTRYRRSGDRRAVRHVNRHRTPARKAYDWLKKKSSYLSFILIVALCAGVYWYGLDNLLSLKFMPEKDTTVGNVPEQVEDVDDADALAAASTVADTVEDYAPSASNFTKNLPTPPPPRKQKGISSVGIGSEGAAREPRQAPDAGKQPGATGGKAPAQESPAPNAPDSKVTGSKAPDSKAQAKSGAGDKKKPDAGAGAKQKTPAPQTGELATAVSKGDFATVKRMADGGSAAAAGVMAKRYLKENNYAAADQYARMAKKGGDASGAEVEKTLRLMGYYD